MLFDCVKLIRLNFDPIFSQKLNSDWFHKCLLEPCSLKFRKNFGVLPGSHLSILGLKALTRVMMWHVFIGWWMETHTLITILIDQCIVLSLFCVTLELLLIPRLFSVVNRVTYSLYQLRVKNWIPWNYLTWSNFSWKTERARWILD